MPRKAKSEIQKDLGCINKECEYFNKVGSIIVIGKSGRNRYCHCCKCQRHFSETYGTIFSRKKTLPTKIVQVLQALAEGNSIRGCERLFKVKKDAIINWLIQAGKHCEEVEKELVKKFKFNQVQIDELWTFIEKKTTHTVVREEKKKKLPS